MGSGHSKISPSSSERWTECPGSIALSAKCPPQEGSIFAAEGTVAHSIAEELVTGKATEAQLRAQVGTIRTSWDGFKVRVSDEMVDGAVAYKLYINKLMQDIMAQGKPAQVHTKAEAKVYAKSIDDELYGTADFLIFQKGNHLIVIDYKFGKGIIVDPKENSQMGIYLIGAMDTIAGSAYTRLTMVIFQPRAAHIDGPVRTWEVPLEWVTQFRNDLKKAVAETRKPEAKLSAGSWCRWCPAKSICPAITTAIQEQTKLDFSVIPAESTVAKKGLPDVRTLSAQTLSNALSWEDGINSWYEALKIRARAMLDKGLDVPGYKLVDGRATRNWTSEEEVLNVLSIMYGDDELFEKRELKSPTQMEKVVGKGKLEEMGLIKRSLSGKVIARMDDPRPSAKTSAHEDFGVIEREVAAEDPLAGFF